MRRLMLLLALLLFGLTGCLRPSGTKPPPVVAVEPGPASPATDQAPSAVAPPPQSGHYRLTIYTLDNLKGHKAPGPDTWPFDANFTGFALAPDGKTALLFPADPNEPADPAALLDLPTGKRTPLPVPSADWYCCGGWLPDGRLYLSGGGKLYVGTGADLHAVADVGLVWNAAPSPDGKTLALWAPGADGRVTLADLGTGALRPLTPPFRRCAQDGVSHLAWSPDGRQLAGTDCEGQKPRIRMVDVQADRPVNQIEGWTLRAWLATGQLLAVAPNPGIAAVTTRLDPSGRDVGPTTALGEPSPDGKYLLYGAYKRQYVLWEYATGQNWALDLAPDRFGWTAEGRLWVITNR